MKKYIQNTIVGSAGVHPIQSLGLLKAKGHYYKISFGGIYSKWKLAFYESF